MKPPWYLVKISENDGWVTFRLRLVYRIFMKIKTKMKVA